MGRHVCGMVMVLVVVCAATLSWGQTAQDALSMLKEAHELQQKAKSQGDLEKAMQKYEQALSAFSKIGKKTGEAVCLNNIGLVYKSWGQYAKALEYYEKSLEITRKIGDTKQEGVTLNNIAGVYDSWGQYTTALEYYEKALEIMKKIGDVKGQGYTLNGIGWVYESWGQYAKALEYYEKALAIHKKVGNAKEEGKVGGLSFARLPLTGDLANDLNASFKGSCTVFTGLKASKETFLKDVAPRLDDYSKVVFATHGYFGKGLPGINEPVLVFTLVPPGTDGYLRMSEVMGLKMNADMVALTACQTGLGKELSGEGVMSMGRAFHSVCGSEGCSHESLGGAG